MGPTLSKQIFDDVYEEGMKFILEDPNHHYVAPMVEFRRPVSSCTKELDSSLVGFWIPLWIRGQRREKPSLFGRTRGSVSPLSCPLLGNCSSFSGQLEMGTAVCKWKNIQNKPCFSFQFVIFRKGGTHPFNPPASSGERLPCFPFCLTVQGVQGLGWATARLSKLSSFTYEPNK